MYTQQNFKEFHYKEEWVPLITKRIGTKQQLKSSTTKNNQYFSSELIKLTAYLFITLHYSVRYHLICMNIIKYIFL